MKSNKKRIKRAWKKQKTKNELEEIETELERLETKIIKEGIRGIRRIWNKNIKNENRK